MLVKHTLFAGLCGATLVAGCSSASDAGLDAGGSGGGQVSGGTSAGGASAGTGAGATGGTVSSAGASSGGASSGGRANSAGGTSSGGASSGAGSASGGTSGGNAGQGGAATGTVGPRFIGRFDVSNPGAPVFAWPGTAISARFKGTEISLTLTESADDGSNLFDVFVDGQLTVVPSVKGMHKYALASGLADGPHDVLVYRRTEAYEGDTVFNGFDVDPSAFLPNEPAPAHRLEVIGDSISAGYGDEGTYPCVFSAATENHYLSYEALTARAVNAELYTEAWSGIGMIRNYLDDTTNPRMPDRYPLTVPDKTANWDFSRFVPEAVVINLGTNDFAAGDPGSSFQSTFTTFVTALRGHYPNARLYLAVGPMLGGDQYNQDKAYLDGVIAARAGAGDANLTLLEFGIQDSADGLGCDYHPSLTTHQKMSTKLVAALKADLGW